MSKIVFLNGKFIKENIAKISIFDRGILFSDSVYEVTAFIRNKLLDFDLHLLRLQRSINELNIKYQIIDSEILKIHKELIKKNNLQDREGLIYFHISRGNAERDFLISDKQSIPNIFAFSQKKNLTKNSKYTKGLNIICIKDLRWKRRDIKTTQLIYPSIAKTKAIKEGADDAWLVDEKKFITEGTSNNAYIIINKTIITRNLSSEILHGITRKTVLEVAQKLKLEIDERPFSIKEAKFADEAFITSASTLVAPVIKIDNKVIGDGHIGTITKILRDTYIDISLKNGF